MTNRYTRRRLISSILSVSALVVSGCGEPTQRTLHGRDIQPPRSTATGVVIELTVSASTRNINYSEATFESVSAIAYTASKRIVGREPVGTVEIGTEPSLSLSCSERPDYLSFTLDSSDCEHPTLIAVHEVRPPDSELLYPAVYDKRCGDPDVVVPDE